MKILIIEDDNYWCNLWNAAFDAQEWQSLAASTAGEAFFLLDRFPFDLIVSDIRLPDGDGFSVRLELNRRKISVPIIFLSSYLPQDAVLIARKLGASALLTKPVSGDELVCLIKQILNNEVSG